MSYNASDLQGLVMAALPIHFTPAYTIENFMPASIILNWFLITFDYLHLVYLLFVSFL